MKSELLMAINQLAAEKNLPREVVLRTAEQALITALKKDDLVFNQSISVKINPVTGEVRIFVQKQVAETVTDPHREISAEEAHRYYSEAKVGEMVEVMVNIPAGAGRIAAQTAKQVLLQRLRDAEHSAIFEEFHTREADVVSGIVQRIEPKQIYIALGRGEGVLPQAEQVSSEHYRPGQHLKFFLVEVQRTPRGTQMIVSRSHKNLLRRLMELGITEIHQGLVEIKSIAREAGSRSKVAVASRQEGVDPVGSCVGQRGIRIQSIVRELNGEKIDVVAWHPDPAVFIASALSPAQVLNVNIKDGEKTAVVVVPDKQLSLAIGREGQNARLAAKLTGWRIDIKSASVAAGERQVKEAELQAVAVARATAEAERIVAQAAAQATAPLQAAAAPAAQAVPQPVEAVAAHPVPPPTVAEPTTPPQQVAAVPSAEMPAPQGETAPAEVPAAPSEETQSFEELFRTRMPVEKGGLRFAEDIPELRRAERGKKKREEEAKGKKAKHREVRLGVGEEEEP